MAFHVETQAGCTLVVLDRPPVNLLDMQAVTALTETFRAQAEAQPLILTGTGTTFSAGVDTRAFTAYSTAERGAFFDAITQMVTSLVSLSAPVVTAINGHALGGGMVLALCADYRLVAEGKHKFGLTEAAAGVPFPAGPMEVIRHEVPAPLLRQLTLSSRIISAETLLHHAVIDEILPATDLTITAVERAKQLASQPAFAQVKTQTRGTLAARLRYLAGTQDET